MIKWATLVCIVVFHFMGGCASKASDELLGTMCDNKLKVSGVLRGTVYEEEAKRITDEYKTKEDNLKAEMERDLKGMDDVLAGRLKAIESGEGEETDEQKEERIKAAKEDIEKKKKGITDQFEPLIKKFALVQQTLCIKVVQHFFGWFEVNFVVFQNDLVEFFIVGIHPSISMTLYADLFHFIPFVLPVGLGWERLEILWTDSQRRLNFP